MRKIRAHFGDDLAGKTIAMWGLAFKANTDDVREAPSITMARALSSDGAKLRVCDPEANDNWLANLGDVPSSVESFTDPYAAAKGADALILATEWRQFRSPDFPRLAKCMAQMVLFDGRNQWERAHVESLGFSYYAIGR